MNTTLVLLDTGNLHYCVRRTYQGRRIDYKKILDTWCSEIEGEVAISAFGAIANKSAYSFRDALYHYGFTVHFKELNDKVKYYNPMIDIVLEAVNNANRVSCIILGTSNQEFMPLIHWLKARSILVGIWACNISIELQKLVNFHKEITEEILIDSDPTKNQV